VTVDPGKRPPAFAEPDAEELARQRHVEIITLIQQQRREFSALLGKLIAEVARLK
jgi:hypothetical protein